LLDQGAGYPDQLVTSASWQAQEGVDVLRPGCLAGLPGVAVQKPRQQVVTAAGKAVAVVVRLQLRPSCHACCWRCGAAAGLEEPGPTRRAPQRVELRGQVAARLEEPYELQDAGARLGGQLAGFQSWVLVLAGCWRRPCWAIACLGP
jgi:hypothetical protein